ncbi:MAG: hypothetical protein ABI451_01555, partial [Dokdonella sp.]
MVLVSLGIITGFQPARAAIGAADTVPGATLLFPYFEVDTNSSTGVDTFLSIRNTSATAILGHITVWTDLGYPVLTFNIYMTGYDVVSLDLRDTLVNRHLPRTASAGQDPGDTISHHGSFSQDINFASCTGQLPYPTLALNASFASDLRSLLSGGPAVFLSGKCAGFNHGDAIARGYVTIDTVNNCTQRMPGNVGYFGNGGTGDATNQNVMAGEYFLVDSGNALLHQGAAVAVQASATDPSTSDAGRYTFYGRVNSFNVA